MDGFMEEVVLMMGILLLPLLCLLLFKIKVYNKYKKKRAIKVLQLLNLPHPRCVMTFEGEEESGSASYMHYINMLT